VPYGISLVSGPETNYWARTEAAAIAQIVAADRFWHANTVRIQVSEAQLLDNPTPGHRYNVPFAASVNRLVCKVVRQGQIPVVNDTTLFTTKQRGPTARTVRFWEFMSRRYGNRLPVIFDLFDEPRLGRNPRTNHFLRAGSVWRLWERGGRIAGKAYLGMQRLVDTIRITEHVDNVIWAEEPWYLDADRLLTAELPEHLLRGENIVYAFHKVNLQPGSKSFRALQAVAAQGIPLVDSEWSQFAATTRPWECQDSAYAGVPLFLAFLRQVPIGIVAWSLQPGALVKGPPGLDTVHDGNDFRFTTNPYDLATPNAMRPDYRCDATSLGQGVGALIQDYFAKYSDRSSAALFPTFG
jgi:Cellulase (glycosyl hydrolase family 5)